jgi:hypothetical protein
MSNTDNFVDAVYDSLEKLYEKDTNFQKQLLGNEPIVKLFDVYSDWLAFNQSLNPKIAANTIYKDAIRVGYMDFGNRKLKKNTKIDKQQNFNLIYGSEQDINEAIKLMTILKQKNIEKYYVVLEALEKIKEMNDYVKPSKNIFGKTTNAAKLNVAPLKMPQINSLKGLLNMDIPEILEYINKFDNALSKHK